MGSRQVEDEPSERPDLVLGVIDKLPLHEINRFLTTLRQSGFGGHVCLFAGPRMGRLTLAAIRGRGVELIRYGKLFHSVGGERVPEPIHLYNLRHFLYRDYLEKHGHTFRNVMITDVRDVVFQRDPFEFEIDDRIQVAMESRAIPIGACDHTIPS